METFLQLTFLSIDIENSRSCQYDFLSLTFADSSREKYCGRQLPDPQEGALPATFSFSTDVSVGGRGFSISFQGNKFITKILSNRNQFILNLKPRFNDLCVFFVYLFSFRSNAN